MNQPAVQHLNPPGMHASPAFSQAVVVPPGASTVYIGGQNGVDATGAIVGKGDLRTQTEQVFRNLETVVEAAGGTLHDIVKWNIYVLPGQSFQEGFEVFQQVWGAGPEPPAISVVVVAGLGHPDFLVEIDAVAVIPAK